MVELFGIERKRPRSFPERGQRPQRLRVELEHAVGDAGQAEHVRVAGFAHDVQRTARCGGPQRPQRGNEQDGVAESAGADGQDTAFRRKIGQRARFRRALGAGKRPTKRRPHRPVDELQSPRLPTHLVILSLFDFSLFRSFAFPLFHFSTFPLRGEAALPLFHRAAKPRLHSVFLNETGTSSSSRSIRAIMPSSRLAVL